jgi:hypothetical protein
MLVRHWLTALVAAGVLAPVAAGASSDGWQRLRRPLHLPNVARGAACPVRESSRSAEGRPLNGVRPVYLMSVGQAGAGVIQVSEAYRDAKGWVGQKTPWLVERRYGGPMLVRGARLDEDGPVRFAKGYGQHLAELRFVAGEQNSLDGTFRGLASAALFRSPGCYGFQVDGTSYSRVIVMQVIVVMGP